MEYSVFGCRLNKYYLNQWLNYFSDQKLLEKSYLITTCEVTDRAKQKWIKLAKKKLTDDHHLYLTGCGTLKRGNKIETEKFYALYPELRAFADHITLLPESPESVSSSEYWVQSVWTKKYVVIQHGCDNYCSFCLTVLKRGNHVSKTKEEIVEEIRNIEQHWGKEIVLTWVNIAARWCDNSTKADESKFAVLLQYILDNTTIPRIRLSSLGPEYLNDDFFRVIQDERILPHFHLSLQSFSDWILQDMRRNYTYKDLVRVLAKFRALKRSVPVSLWADIIVWFPGETEKEFQKTLQWIQDFKINKAHAFPFSDHHIGEKIPASTLPNQVDQATKLRRAKQLKKITDQLADQFLEENKWIIHEVLVEWKGSGWTENYIKVDVVKDYKRGDIVELIL